MSDSRPRAARVAIALAQWLVVALATLTVGEIVARLAGEHPLTTSALVWQHDPRLGWSQRPNARDLFVKSDFSQPIQINSHGLREREIPYEKPPGTQRVLVLGDSAVVGFEVAEQERFTAVAERLLRERGYPVELINAGTRGWGTDQSLLYLEDEGLRYQPDLVLYMFTDNDPYDNATIHRPYRVYGKPWFTLDAAGALVLRGVPVPLYPYTANLRVDEHGDPVELPIGWRKGALLWVRDVFVCHSAFASWLTQLALRLPALTQPMSSAASYGDETDRPTDLGPRSHTFRVTLAMVREMERRSHAAGAGFAMLNASTGFGAEIRKETDLLDLRDMPLLLHHTPRGAQLLVPNDPHWNALGHRLYGEVLAQLLVESGLLGPPPAAKTAAAGALAPDGGAAR